MDEDVIKKPKAHEIGMSLDALSVDELAHRIALLEDEIDRLKSAVDAKGQTRRAADSVFKF